MTSRWLNNFIAVCVVLAWMYMLLLLAGCASVDVTRHADGRLEAKYSKFLTKMDQPEFKIVKKNENEYTVIFNAESIDESASAGTISNAFGSVLMRGGSISATLPEEN